MKRFQYGRMFLISILFANLCLISLGTLETRSVLAKTSEQSLVEVETQLPEGDPATDIASYNCALVTEIPEAECKALVALYSSTNGGNWYNSSNWLMTTTPCSWYGVACTTSHVTGILMFNNHLAGSIPDKLGSLLQLKQLDLGANLLSGSIPETLTNLTQLEQLNLGWNSLSGTIPSWFDNFSNLNLLDLGGNYFSGSIPAELGNLSLLRELDLGWNDLSGSIPTGFVNLTQMEILNLCNNQLSGTIPDFLGELTNLKELYLYNNQFSDSIPDELENLTQLRALDLSNNSLSGNIPAGIGNITYLYLLDLSNNQLNGSIPGEIGNLIWLVQLDLSENNLTGKIPTRIGNLTNLSTLYLNNNLLSGTVPAELGNLSLLSSLNLGWNSFDSGSIPASLGNLTNLKEVYLAGSRFNGSIPPELANLTQLEHLYLNNNQLSGTIPAWIGNLTNLNEVNLADNYLSGVVSAGFGNLAELIRLEIQGNYGLTGSLPNELTNLTKLETFYYNNTALCELSTSTFQNWLKGIDDLKRTSKCGVPAQPVSISPSGEIDTWNPTFRWNITADTNSYQLYIYQKINSTVTVIHNQAYAYSTANCEDNNICEITPDITLGSGSYDWKVCAKNLSGSSIWSTTLTISTHPKPAAPTAISPTGSSTNWNPTFTWTPTDYTQSYALYVYKKSGTTVSVVHYQWYTSEDAGCSSGTCSMTPTINPGGGMYYWKVLGKNPSGKSPWSTTLSFTTPPVPGKITAIAPVTNSENWTPTFSWNKDDLAQSYVLYIYKKSGTTVTEIHKATYTAETAVCDDDGVCEITPAVTLGGGTYYWNVRGKNPSGKGAWSTRLAFATPAVPGQVTLITPPETSGGIPTLQWNEEASSQSYLLYIYKVSGTVVTPIHKTWYTAETAGCSDDGICEITPEITLKSGGYYWKVRGKNPSGKGAWSTVGTFTIVVAP